MFIDELMEQNSVSEPKSTTWKVFTNYRLLGKLYARAENEFIANDVSTHTGRIGVKQKQSRMIVGMGKDFGHKNGWSASTLLLYDLSGMQQWIVRFGIKKEFIKL